MNSYQRNADDSEKDIRPKQGITFSQSISSIDWSPVAQDTLACTLWDGTLKIFQITKNDTPISPKASNLCLKELISTKVTDTPLTYCGWTPNNAIILGTGKGQIKAFNPNTSQIVDIGSHSAAINFVKAFDCNSIFSSAYENNVYQWDLRTPNKPTQKIIYSKKVFKSSFNNGILATALADELVGLVHINALSKKVQINSQLGKGSYLQAIEVSPNGKYIGLGSIDGRVNISKIESTNLQIRTKTMLTFKAHKRDQIDFSILYPVNSVNFNSYNQNWFSTCGSDGTMHFWNHQTRNKNKSMSFSQTPVCISKVSNKGKYLAYGLGNDWHTGKQGQKWKSTLAVHEITMQDFNGKQSS